MTEKKVDAVAGTFEANGQEVKFVLLIVGDTQMAMMPESALEIGRKLVSLASNAMMERCKPDELGGA